MTQIPWEWPGWEPPLKPLGLCYKMEHWHLLCPGNSGSEASLWLQRLYLESHQMTQNPEELEMSLGGLQARKGGLFLAGANEPKCNKTGTEA